MDVLVIFQTAGSGTFNADARRLAGLQQEIPIELTDERITFFKPMQDHFKLCRFGRGRVKVSTKVKKY